MSRSHAFLHGKGCGRAAPRRCPTRTGSAKTGAMDNFREVDGRVCVITGGGRGIGRATALELARNGARVAVVDRDLGPAEEVAAEIGRLGRTARAYALDVTKVEEVGVVLARIERELGEIDV